MKVDGVVVEKMTDDSFSGSYNGVSIDIERLGFHSGYVSSEWRLVLKGPVKLSDKVKALYFSTGFGLPDTHITEVIEFAKTKVAQ